VILIYDIWDCHQKQLDSLGYELQFATAIDASYLDTNRGAYGKLRGDEAKTRRSKDGVSATKNKEKHFGYKMHIIMDLMYQLIRKFDVYNCRSS
jgi:IS5 family transposase